MAQDSNQILNQILHVVTQIRDQGKTSSGEKGKSDKGTGTLFEKFGIGQKQMDPKKADQAARAVKTVLEAITDFGKEKVNHKDINKTSISLKKLFETIVWMGEKERTVNRTLRLFDKLAKSLQTMTKWAKAMSVLMVAVGGSMVLFATGLALSAKLMGMPGKPLLAVGAMILVLTALTGTIVLLGMFHRQINRGSRVARRMGIALGFLGLGLFVFTETIVNIGRHLGAEGGAKSIIYGTLGAIGIIGAMAMVFYLMGGKLAKNIAIGSVVAMLMGVGMASLAWGLDKFADTIQKLVGLGDSSKSQYNKKGEERGQFGKMMAQIGPGLGVIGIMVVSSAVMFGLLGIPMIAAAVGLGAGVAIMIGAAMNVVAKGAIKLSEASKEIPPDFKDSIKTMLSGMIGGVIGGLSEGLTGKAVANARDLSFKGFIKINTGLGLIRRMSRTVSLFAKALTAFAELDRMKVITGYDENGKPEFGENVDVKQVGQNVKSTLSSFLTGLIESTVGLTTKQARAIKKMSRALIGRRGMLSAIIKFADVLKVYAEFGEKNEIGYVTYDDEGKEIRTKVKVDTVVSNMIGALATFTNALFTRSDQEFGDGEYVEKPTRKQKKAAQRMSKALTGRHGVLGAMVQVGKTIETFSKFGANGMIPILNENGEKIGEVSIQQAADNAIKGISIFATKLNSLTFEDGDNIYTSTHAIDKWTGFMDSLSSILNKASDMQRFADATGALAENVGELVINVDKLNPMKLETLAALSAKGVNVQTSAQETTGGGSSATTTSLSSTAPTTTAPTTTKIVIDNLDNLPTAVGNAVAAALKNGQFTFQFLDQNTGVLEFD